MVTAGTIELLIERLADEHHPDTAYVDIFMLGYRYLLSSSSLLDKLITRFNVIPPPKPTEEQINYYNKYAGVIKVRVVGVIKKWIDAYWVDFETNELAYERLQNFLDDVCQDSDKALANLGNRLRKIIVEKQNASKEEKLRFGWSLFLFFSFLLFSFSFPFFLSFTFLFFFLFFLFLISFLSFLHDFRSGRKT